MKKGQNFLELVPKRHEEINWKTDNDTVKLIVMRDSLLDKIVRKIFKTPDKTVVDLDEIGSLVWKNIDGEKNIFEISRIIKERLGKSAEPVNERLITYIKILKNNDFIKLETE